MIADSAVRELVCFLRFACDVLRFFCLWILRCRTLCLVGARTVTDLRWTCDTVMFWRLAYATTDSWGLPGPQPSPDLFLTVSRPSPACAWPGLTRLFTGFDLFVSSSFTLPARPILWPGGAGEP